MANFNKVILAGNLTRDPEMRYLTKGTAVTKIGMAINRTWKNDAGESKEEVTFVDAEAYGRTAEVIAQYLKKGRPILIEGRLKLDQWEDKNTHQKQSKLKVVVESFQFLDSGRGDGSGGGHSDGPRVRPAAAATATSTGAAAPAEADAPGGEEDDVPF